MRIFGKAKGGGRRRAARSQSPLLLTSLSTVANEYRVGLVDISSTGAQLTAPVLPTQGEPVIFCAEELQSLGSVVWSHDGQCGIVFDSPIAATNVDRVRQLARIYGTAA